MGERALRLTLFLSLLFLSLVLLMADIKGDTIREKVPPIAWVTGKPSLLLGEATRKGWLELNHLLESIKVRLSSGEAIEKNLKLQAQLRQRIRTLERQLFTYQEAYLENKRLKALLHLKNLLKYRTVGAYPVGGVPLLWGRDMVINAGRDQGVRKGLAVLNSSGIVGVVIEASREKSTVMLITDPAFSIHVVDKRSRVIGVVKGTGGPFCNLQYVMADRDIIPGDLLVTSGMGGVYPKGYPVGTVAKVKREPGELFMKATVRPSVDFSRLGYLLVVLPEGGTKR